MSSINFNPEGSSIVLDVIVTARFPTIARLVLDTGASNVVISRKLSLAIGLTIDSRKYTQTITASRVETIPYVIVPKMSVLGNTVKNVKSIVKDLPQEAGVDGLLGLSYLKHFRLEVDFKKGLLTLD